MLVITARTHKMLDRQANREDPDQIASKESLCLFRFLWQTITVLSKIDENRCKQTLASLP